MKEPKNAVRRGSTLILWNLKEKSAFQIKCREDFKLLRLSSVGKAASDRVEACGGDPERHFYLLNPWLMTGFILHESLTGLVKEAVNSAKKNAQIRFNALESEGKAFRCLRVSFQEGAFLCWARQLTRIENSNKNLFVSLNAGKQIYSDLAYDHTAGRFADGIFPGHAVKAFKVTKAAWESLTDISDLLRNAEIKESLKSKTH